MSEQPPAKATGWRRIVNAAGYSAKGLRSTYETEAAFRQECWLLAVALPLAFWLGDTPLQTALLIGSLLLVLVVELLNSAIESVVDRIGSERHPLSGKAKDQGSAAVLLALFIAALVWIGVLLS